MDTKLKNKLWPLILIAIVVIADQVTKALVVKFVPAFTLSGVPSLFGDFLRIIHVYNTGVAFSVGASWSAIARRILFSAIPIIVLILVMIVYFKNNDFTNLQRWAICGIVGGGLGNIIDRLFRANGVVDFIDIKFYRIFGLERWPTFNIADSAVVICGILLIVSFLVVMIRESKKEKSSNK